MSGFRIFLVTVALAAAIAGLLWWSDGSPSSAADLHLYCAAGMRRPVQEIVDRFEEEMGVQVDVHYAGSGALLSELRVQRSGDLYLAADEGYIRKAQEAGLVAQTVPLALQRIVIAVRAGNPKGIRGLDDLLRDDVKVAYANPDQASVGKQARRILTALGRWQRHEESAEVFKPTVNDVANDVKLGTVDAGLIWDATAGLYEDVDAVRVPELEKETFRVTVGVLRKAKSSAAALLFARYLGAVDRGLEVFRSQGFETVEGDVWEERPELIVWSGGVNRLAIESTVKEFQEREGVDVLVTYAGCGTLCGNMVPLAGKPGFPDVYFACDRSYLDNVAHWYRDGTTVSETDMVIVVPKGNPLGISRLEDLARPGLRLGVADPEKAALGALTKRLLKEAGIHDEVWANVVTTDGTADFLVTKIRVAQGATLDAVIVYDANCPNIRDVCEILPIAHPAALASQPIAISRISPRRQLAQRFIDSILSEESERRFVDVGFRFLHERAADATAGPGAAADPAAEGDARPAPEGAAGS